MLILSAVCERAPVLKCKLIVDVRFRNKEAAWCPLLALIGAHVEKVLPSATPIIF